MVEKQNDWNLLGKDALPFSKTDSVTVRYGGRIAAILGLHRGVVPIY